MDNEQDRMNLLPLTGFDYTVASLTETEYRQWLEHTFRPIFEPYNQIGGIPSRELLNRFQYRDFGLPQDRKKDLILYLDANRDGRVTYEGFYSALVHKRYVDLPPFQRFGLRLLLACNPGLRLAVARDRAIKHLQALDAAGRSAGSGGGGGGGDADGDGKFISSENLPNAITGYAGNCDGNEDGGRMFVLESDGVWPTSRNRKGGRGPVGEGLTIMEEEYIPEVYMEAFKCRPPPIFCPLIVLLQVAVFIYYAVELNRRAVAEPTNALTWVSGFPYFSPLYFDPRRRREVWRFFTYILLDQGIWHVIFNTLVTVSLGSLMEWARGTWRMMVIYLAGVLGGSLATSVWDPTTIGLGAGGGVYALLGTYLDLFVVNWEEVKHDFFAVRRATTVRERFLAVIVSGIARICVVLLLCAIDFGIALYQRYGLPDAPLHASFSPMLAGFIVGVLVGVPLLRDLHDHPWEHIAFWICLGVSLAFLIFTIFWNIFWPGYPAQIVDTL